jgi:methionyl-tRNA formyltransferase
VRIVFFGSSQFSCLVLNALCDGPHEIALVVTQPDQPKGRKLQCCPTVLCQEADALELNVIKPERLKGNTELLAELAALKPDAILVASYSQIIPREILELTPLPLNVHPSLLPLLRGASPIRTALLDGHGVTGCCIMRMTQKLDDGDVMLMQDVEVSPEWNNERLQNELGMLGGEMAQEALGLCESGQARFTPQDHSVATYTKLHRRDDTVIDWARTTGDLYNFVRAWDPDVGALTCLPDGRKLKVWRSSLELPEELALDLMMAPTIPGSVVRVAKDAVWVATADGALQLIDVQPENKSRMTMASFLAGNNLELGECLGY